MSEPLFTFRKSAVSPQNWGWKFQCIYWHSYFQHIAFLKHSIRIPNAVRRTSYSGNALKIILTDSFSRDKTVSAKWNKTQHVQNEQR